MAPTLPPAPYTLEGHIINTADGGCLMCHTRSDNKAVAAGLVEILNSYPRLLSALQEIERACPRHTHPVGMEGSIARQAQDKEIAIGDIARRALASLNA